MFQLYESIENRIFNVVMDKYAIYQLRALLSLLAFTKVFRSNAPTHKFMERKY